MTITTAAPAVPAPTTTPPTATIPMRRLRWLAVGTFALGTESLVVAGILPDLAADLSVTVAQAGLLVAAFALTYALAAPVVGIVVSRWAPRDVLVTAMVVFALTNLAAAAAPTFAFLVVARMLAAVAASAFTPQASALAAAVSAPDQRGRALAVVYTGLTVATVLGVPLGTLVASVGTWRWTFVGVALLSAVAVIGVRFGLPGVPAPTRRSWHSWTAVARRRDILRIASVTYVGTAAQFVVFTYVAGAVVAVAGVSGAVVAVALLVFGAAGVVGNSAGGRLADAIGPERTSRAALLLMASAFVGVTVLVGTGATGATATVIGAALLVMWGIGGWGFVPPTQLRLVRQAPDAGPLVLSVNSSLLYAGIATGGALGSIALSVGGLVAVGTLGAIVAVLAILVVGRAER